MFGEKDLPLFSDTPQRGRVETFDPKPIPQVEQETFIDSEDEAKEEAE
jgi:hypothetical protein